MKKGTKGRRGNDVMKVKDSRGEKRKRRQNKLRRKRG